MGLWQVNADTMAGSRFVVSAAAEASACMFALHKGRARNPGERVWLDAHSPAYEARLAGDPITALLLRAAWGNHWIADFLTPTPPSDDAPDFSDEIDRIRRTPPDVVHADLEVSLRGSLPAALRRDDLAERAAGLLEWVWAETVLPYWPRRRRVLEADIVARTGQLGQRGWAAALDDMRPGMRWLGENRLQINTLDYPPRDVTDARLMFVPVTPRMGWVSWSSDRRFSIVYPCSGVLAEPGAGQVPDALARLLGGGRAAVLMLLGSPKSTSHLVALTGQGLGSVGRHLKVLLDAGLVQRRRSGRSVLYYRTDAGEVLVAAQAR
ncbi:transcriptional regulator [Acrocarpospora phusangensis]|uniref:Transcriptional regulator n=1 Tax=Acrocarpospora phusangensis TaxID=1070424 RepID=A0A919Q8E6_9ACTN|nr:helix-turn-helix domain-containing protein [Acrocarpospora phusangensis]GIH24217.1 transcriptional regulator [Acrocarpospora phusangensis]